MNKESIDPDAGQPTAEYQSHRFLNIAAVLLVLAFVLFLCQLINLGTFRAKASGVDRLPVSIHAASQADYSSNDQGLAIPPIEKDILNQIIRDIPATGAAQDRIATLQAALLSPVPTMTADSRLPMTLSPTLVATHINTSADLSTSIVMTFAIPTRFVPATPTFAYIYPTYAPVVTSLTKTPRPATKTLTPLLVFTATSTSATISSTQTSTATYTPTRTDTNTPTFTPTYTSTNTATNTPTSTFTFTPTNTSTSTATETPTETFTPTATSTPSPTMTLSSGCVAYPTGGFTAAQDTWVDNTNANTSYASDTTLKIRPSAGVDQRGLVAFDLSSIPPGSMVTSAALYLTVTTGDTYAVEFYPVTQPWAETVTWNTQPSYDATSAGSITLTTTACTRVSSFSAALISSWIDDPTSNYGIYLFPPTGAGQAGFSSREGTNPPVLVVNYSP